MDDINIEILISLVEARSTLWDKSLDKYKDKTLKESAWREICTILNEDFLVLEQKERQHFGKFIVCFNFLFARIFFNDIIIFSINFKISNSR